MASVSAVVAVGLPHSARTIITEAKYRSSLPQATGHCVLRRSDRAESTPGQPDQPASGKRSVILVARSLVRGIVGSMITWMVLPAPALGSARSAVAPIQADPAIVRWRCTRPGQRSQGQLR